MAAKRFDGRQVRKHREIHARLGSAEKPSQEQMSAGPLRKTVASALPVEVLAVPVDPSPLVGAGGWGMLFLIQRPPLERLLELHGVAFCAIAADPAVCDVGVTGHSDQVGTDHFRGSCRRSLAARGLRRNSMLLRAFLAPNPGRGCVRVGDAAGMYRLPSIFLRTALTVSILRIERARGSSQC